MKLRKRLSLLFATAVSIFGVMVASIATAAWFQISYTQPANITDPGGLVTGSSEVEVDGVTGHKYMWDENTDGTDAETGRVISSTGEGTKDISTNYGNQDEEDIESLDNADQGVGYYILGDSTWASYTASQHSRTGGVAWKYSSSLKMDDRYSYNYAKAVSVELAAGEQIQIKKHTYDYNDVKGKTTTLDKALTTLGSGSDTYVSIDGGTHKITVKAGQSGTYDIFVNTREQICFNQTSTKTPHLNVRSLNKLNPKLSQTVTGVNKIIVYLQDHINSRTWWSYCDTSNSANSRVPIMYGYDIEYESSSNISSNDVTYSMLNDLSLTGITWSSKTVANFEMNYHADYTDAANGREWYFELPWFIKSLKINFFISGWNRSGGSDQWTSQSGFNVWLSTNASNGDTWNATITRADDAGYTYKFETRNWDLAFGWSDGAKMVASLSSSSNWANTGSVTQYSVTYKKNNTNTTLGNADNVYEYTYYTPDDSTERKTAAGDSIDIFIGWYTSTTYATEFTARFIASDTIIYGKITTDVYFALYIVKKKHDNTYLTPVQYKGNDADYYTSDTISQFDPDTFFTSSICASLYPGYAYPNSPAWTIDSKDGNTYNKSTFSAFSTDEENPVGLYLIIQEITITLTRKWVKLRYDGFTDQTSSLLVDAIDPTGTTLTAYGDTAVAPATPSSYSGSPNLSGYSLKTANAYWLDTGAVDSSTIGTEYTESQIFTSNTDIYYLYVPANAYVTYEYHLFVTDAITKEVSEYTSNRPSDTVFKRHSNDGAFTLASHSPTSSWKVGDPTNHAAYYFAWDSKFYTTAACTTEYGSSSVAAGTAQTLYIRLEATVETMYFDAKANIDEWDADLATVYVHLYESIDAGSSPVPCEKLADGIHRFYMTTGVNFMIYNGAGGDRNTRYTTNINLSENDSNGSARGHCDCIKVSNTLGTESHVTWLWSNYFGSSVVSSINRGATMYFTDSVLNTNLFHGDGVYNMYVHDKGLSLNVNDAFALRFNNHGVYEWYDYDNLDSNSKKYVYDTSSETYSSATIGGVSWTTSVQVGDVAATTGKHVIKFKYAGYYTFYFTAQGQVSIASVPGAKGEGYYIMPYDSTGVNGNNLKSSFNNCLKMRTTGLSSGTDGNVAIYKNFNVTDTCKSFYIKSFLGGVENGPMAAMGENQYAIMGTGDNEGVFTFKTAGKYNIYLQRTSSSSDNPYYTIYITEVTAKGFFSMNEIVTEHDSDEDGESTILEQKTTMVLEVKFRSTANSGSINVGAGFMRTGTAGSPKLSKYLNFGVMYNSTALGLSCFDSARENSVYSTLSSFADDNAMSLDKFDNTSINDNGWHYLYIILDYNVGKTTLEANRADLINDFKIVLKARG